MQLFVYPAFGERRLLLGRIVSGYGLGKRIVWNYRRAPWTTPMLLCPCCSSSTSVVRASQNDGSICPSIQPVERFSLKRGASSSRGRASGTCIHTQPWTHDANVVEDARLPSIKPGGRADLPMVAAGGACKLVHILVRVCVEQGPLYIRGKAASISPTCLARSCCLTADDVRVL